MRKIVKIAGMERDGQKGRRFGGSSEKGRRPEGGVVDETRSVLSKENMHKGVMITLRYTAGSYKAASNQFSDNGPDL